MAIILLFMDSLQVNSEVDNINNLPKYCDFHKFFLVEELVLQDDYTRLHYGKCRVIGRLISINGEFFLENIQITNLDKKYSVPEGTLNIQLCTDEKSEHALENGKYCEILGETIITNPQGATKTFETIPLTSRGLVEQMQYITESNSKEKLLSYYKENYRPAINVWFAKQISSAADLISRNLEIRLLEQAVESL